MCNVTQGAAPDLAESRPESGSESLQRGPWGRAAVSRRWRRWEVGSFTPPKHRPPQKVDMVSANILGFLELDQRVSSRRPRVVSQRLVTWTEFSCPLRH